MGKLKRVYPDIVGQSWHIYAKVRNDTRERIGTFDVQINYYNASNEVIYNDSAQFGPILAGETMNIRTNGNSKAPHHWKVVNVYSDIGADWCIDD